MREKEIQDAIRLHLGKYPDLVLFRNQSGFIDRDAPCEHCHKRPTRRKGAERYGLAPGASDLIGVGPGGRFTAYEVKRPGEEPSSDQEVFLSLVRKFGGNAGWGTSTLEADQFYWSIRGNV